MLFAAVWIFYDMQLQYKVSFLWFLWLQFIFHSVVEYYFITIQMEMNEWTMCQQKKINVNSLFLYFICSHVILNVYFIIWMQDSTKFLYEWMDVYSKLLLWQHAVFQGANNQFLHTFIQKDDVTFWLETISLPLRSTIMSQGTWK